MTPLSPSQRLLLAVFALFALSFIVSLALPPYPGRFMVKAVPALALGAFVFRSLPGRAGTLPALALLFSAGGDVALELDRANYFVIGLGLFLVAHLFYIATFARDAQRRAGRWPAIALLLAYVIILTALLLPTLGEMTLPVLAYVVVITAMGLTAAFRAGRHSLTVLLGAYSFILSDSLIAIDRFLATLPAGSVAIMITYYTAQFLIAYGLVQGHARAPAGGAA